VKLFGELFNPLKKVGLVVVSAYKDIARVNDATEKQNMMEIFMRQVESWVDGA
jgi:hypothetical protein